jgi:hypothetical protein
MEGPENVTVSEIVTKRLRQGDCMGEVFITTFRDFMKRIVDPADPEDFAERGERADIWEDAVEEQDNEGAGI